MSRSKHPLDASIGTRLELVIAELAGAQFGVVSRAQLFEAGVGRGAIARRMRSGHLQALHPGVYAVGHRVLTQEGRWMAAVLAGGPGAVLSHVSAAAAWELLAPRAAARARRARIDVTVPGRRGDTSTSVQAHSCQLDPQDVTHRGPLPLTTVPRTLLDYAELGATADDLDRALEAAHRQRRLPIRDLEATLARAMGRRGLKPLTAALERLDPLKAMTRSELERRAIALVRAHALPPPAVNARRSGYELDLSWPDRRLVVELDGRAFHATAAAFERDRRRDADLQARGHRVVRFTWRQVVQDPGWVGLRLAQLLA